LSEPSVVTVVLAAGAGRRLGGVAKALLRRSAGATYLESVCAAARAAGAGDGVVVVADPHRADTEAEALRLGWRCALNPAPERGMASSVEVGFAHVRSRFAGAVAALLWPVDHARVRAETVQMLVARAGQGAIVVPRFRGRGGHPTLFGRETWPELEQCGALAQGARSVLRADPGRVVGIDVDDPGVVEDVDTLGDRP
jgi:CTP:molybdopterin cytidylyltransferase MocA